MVGSVLNAIGGFFAGAARGVADLGRKVWHAFTSLFHLLGVLYHAIGSAWGWFHDHVIAFFVAVGQLAEDAYNALANIVTNIIPDAARWAFSHAVHWAHQAIVTVERAVTSVIHRTYKILRGAIVHAENYLHGIIRGVVKVVRQVVHWVRSAGARLWDLVMHPAKLVKWILPHLIVPLLRFLVTAGRPVIVWLVRAALPVMRALAHEIEAALVELF